MRQWHYIRKPNDSLIYICILKNVHWIFYFFSPPQRIPEELTLDALLEMNESKVKETMKRCGARDEECSRLNGALSCLRKVTESGTDCLFCSVALGSQQPRSHPASFYVRQSAETFGSLGICCNQFQVVVLGCARNCSDQTRLELWNGFVFDIMFSYWNKGMWKYPLQLNRNCMIIPFVFRVEFDAPVVFHHSVSLT